LKIYLITELYPVHEDDWSTTHALRDFVNLWDEDLTVFRPLQLSVKNIRKLKTYLQLYRGPLRYMDHSPLVFFLLIKWPFVRKYFYRIRKRQNITPPDVILAHSLMGNYVAKSMSKHYGVPFSAGIHNYDIQNLEKERQQYEEVFRQASLIVCRSQPIKEHFNRITGDRFKDLIFIANSGIRKELIEDHSFFMKKAEELNEHQCRYITVSRLLPFKNVGVSINVLSDLKEDYSYTIIGDGAGRATLQEQIDHLGFSDRMTIHGWKTQEEVFSFLKEADIFILASAPETFGLAYLEAMAKACIVIGAYGWGIDGIIKHGENGFLVQPGDPESLKKVLNQIKDLSIKKRKEIASAARETILELTDQKVAEAYLLKVKELKTIKNNI